MKRHILDDAIAFIENFQNCGSLGHGRHSAFAMSGRSHLTAAWKRRVLARSALAARGERERGKQRCGGARHAYSGIQGS